MDTSAFRTRTEFRALNYPSVDNKIVVGLDMGYSSVKGVFKDGVFCFPSFCRKLTKDIFGELDATDIIYKDEVTGERYAVGDFATASLKKGQYVTESVFYDRNHYMTPEYLACFRTGMAFALWNTPDVHNNIFIQTGLPPAYLSEDSAYIKHVMVGEHKFSVTKGKETRGFNFEIKAEDIDIMYQPMGTMYSVGIDDKGLMTQDLIKYLKSSVLVFDAGFGTLDKFAIINKTVDFTDTDNNLGMLRILSVTRDIIKDNLGVEVSIPEMQNCLKTGRVTKVDRINMTKTSHDIGTFLKEANNKVCNEAYESLRNEIFNFDYLIMTGGVGAAWYHTFSEKLKDAEITVIPGNQHSTLSYIYANARGYFMFRTMSIKRKQKNS